MTKIRILVILLLFPFCLSAQIFLQEINPNTEDNCFNAIVKGPLADLKDILKNKDQIESYQIINNSVERELSLLEAEIVNANMEQIDLHADDYHIVIDVGSSVGKNEKILIERLLTRLSDYLHEEITKGKKKSVYFLGDELQVVFENFNSERDLESLKDQLRRTKHSKTKFRLLRKLLHQSKKILLLSSGFVDSRNSKIDEEYNVFLKALREKNIESKIEIYPMVLNPNNYNVDFFNSIIKTLESKNQIAFYPSIPNFTKKTYDPERINLSLKLTPSHAKPDSYILGPEKREIVLKFHNGSQSSKQLQSRLFPIRLNLSSNNKLEKKEHLMKSLLLGGIILFLCYVFIPLYKRYLFKKNHIFSFGDIQKPNVKVSRDPVTRQEFQCTDMVVKVDEQMMSLETWKMLKKMDNPELNHDYKAFFKGKTGDSLFGQYQTEFKPLFWFFFSFLGFFITWGLYSFIEYFNENLLNELDNNFHFDLPFFSSIPLAKLFIFSFILIVLSFSFTRLGLHLAKRTQMPVLSFLQLTVVSIFSCWALLIGVYYFFINIVYLNIGFQFCAWSIVIFCSSYYLQTQMQVERTLIYKVIALGALITTLVASILFFTPFSSSANFLLALLCISSGMAFIFSMDEFQYNSYGFMVLEPSAFSGKKYLLEGKTKSNYIIGTAPDCEIRLQWMDIEAKEKHALISAKNFDFKIEPFQGIVYINGDLVETETSLKNGDIVQLGERSVTKFKFKEFSTSQAQEENYSSKAKHKSIPQII